MEQKKSATDLYEKLEEFVALHDEIKELTNIEEHEDLFTKWEELKREFSFITKFFIYEREADFYGGDPYLFWEIYFGKDVISYGVDGIEFAKPSNNVFSGNPMYEARRVPFDD